MKTFHIFLCVFFISGNNDYKSSNESEFQIAFAQPLGLFADDAMGGGSGAATSGLESKFPKYINTVMNRDSMNHYL